MNIFKIMPGTKEDVSEILALYKANLGGPADWNEYYPNEDTINFDLSRDALFVMKNENGEIIATISIDDDEEVNRLSCWNKDLQPSGEVSRLCVREDMRNQGIAREMMLHTFALFKAQGYKSVHILVKTGHIVALKSYSQLGFEIVGDCTLFDKDFLCLELKLE